MFLISSPKYFIIALLCNIAGLMLVYFNWFGNEYTPSSFFMIIGFFILPASLVYYVKAFEGERSYGIKESLGLGILSACLLYFGINYTKKYYFSYGTRLTEAYVYWEVKGTPRNSTSGLHYVYRCNNLKIKKGLAEGIYENGDAIVVKFAPRYPEISEVVGFLNDTLIKYENPTIDSFLNGEK